jgi:predicted HicB family RNase H-like nuclease
MKTPKGRPPKALDKVLGIRLQMRISAAERKAYEAAADKSGMSMSEWIRETLNKATARSGK